MSARDRIRSLAVEMAASADVSHLQPPSLSTRYAPVYEAIKAYFLGMGNDLTAWHLVSNNPQKFNRVWCSMLGIKYENAPPAPVWRFLIPSINQLSIKR